MDRLGKGLPNLYLGTELARFSSGSSKDREGRPRDPERRSKNLGVLTCHYLFARVEVPEIALRVPAA